ncbi:hypothetical protein FQN51_006622 [Onygenales sp. PD_10]|nr:hypothetical protein FQN51_006622 [Onygenales sp. PD_10]
MEQLPKVLKSSQIYHLDIAARAVSSVLTSQNKRHGFIGGYAVTLLGGDRVTNDVDVIVGESPRDIRKLLLEADKGFSLTEANKLVFKVRSRPPLSLGESNSSKTGPPDSSLDVVIELLQGGADKQLRLPDAETVPLTWINPSEFDSSRPNHAAPIVDPGVLILTKLKRWMFLAESTRPKSVTRAENDFYDMEKILRWLDKRSATIDMARYPETSKEKLLQGLRLLIRADGGRLYDLLKSTLPPDDFQAIQ